MRDYLYGSSAIISVTFFLQNGPVDFSSCHIGIFIQALINESFIVSQIQIRLGTVIRNEHFPMLNRIHRTRIHIDIWVKLLHSHFIASGFQKSPKRSCRNSLSKAGYYATCHKHIFYCHHIFLLV